MRSYFHMHNRYFAMTYIGVIRRVKGCRNHLEWRREWPGLS